MYPLRRIPAMKRTECSAEFKLMAKVEMPMEERKMDELVFLVPLSGITSQSLQMTERTRANDIPSQIRIQSFQYS